MRSIVIPHPHARNNQTSHPHAHGQPKKNHFLPQSDDYIPTMISVDQITEQVLGARHDSLTPALQDALDSPRNIEIVAQVCKNHHLVDEEKIVIIQQLVALVLLGFIHEYDISKEINDSLELNNPKLTNSIGEELRAKIFSHVKSELDKNYQPVTQEKVPPLVISEVKKPDTGERVVRLDSLRVESGGSPSLAIKPPSALTPTPPAPTASSGPSAPMGAPPLIIHQESTAEPMKKVPPMGFGASNQLDTIKTEIKIPPRPARLEIGGTWPPKAPAEKPIVPMPPRPISEPPRAIHYGQFRTPIEEKNIIPPAIVPPTFSEKPPAPQQPQKPAPPPAPTVPSGPVGGPTASSGPSNLPVIPATSPKTLIIEEEPKQKSIPPQGIMPQTKPQSPAFLPRPNIEKVTTASPVQKSTPARALPKPPSPPAPTASSGPPPPRAAETQTPKSTPAPIGTISPNIRSVAPPPAPPEKNPIAPSAVFPQKNQTVPPPAFPPRPIPPTPASPAPMAPSGQVGGPPPQREPVIDLDTLKERAGG